jgi:HEPN domain-containing protein
VGSDYNEDVVAVHAQQAAEKALRGCLVWLQIELPKTHDIERLMSQDAQSFRGAVSRHGA